MRLFLTEEHVDPNAPPGPFFHRWLPDGARDAISLETGEAGCSLKVWFERCGFVDEAGFIRFTHRQHEVDASIVERQAKLEAGPLICLLELRDVPEETLAAVREDRVGDDLYVRLGKRLVKRSLFPFVRRFISVLRITYGQYWLRELPEWDSRQESIGNYLGRAAIDWSLDGGQTWRAFCPEERVWAPVVGGPREHFFRYITHEDWAAIAHAVREGYEPSVAAESLGRAHELLEQGNARYAIIEAVTALEVALHEFARRRAAGIAGLQDRLSAFWNLSVSTQLATVASFIGGFTEREMKAALELIAARHGLVHEGQRVNELSSLDIPTVLRLIARFLDGPGFKFAVLTNGNILFAAPEATVPKGHTC
jgi:hypothetical protein